MQEIYGAMLPWAQEMPRPKRRYLTDPNEIRAYRRKHLALLWQEVKLGVKHLPQNLFKLYHRVVAELTFAAAVLSIWFGSLALFIWAISFIVEHCTV